jgi:hypothetical protein
MTTMTTMTVFCGFIYLFIHSFIHSFVQLLIYFNTSELIRFIALYFPGVGSGSLYLKNRDKSMHLSFLSLYSTGIQVLLFRV